MDEGGSSSSDLQTTKDEQSVITFMKQYNRSVTGDDLSEHFPHLDANKLMPILNKLISQGIIIVRMQGRKLNYSLKKSHTVVQNLKISDNEEKVVFSIVEQAANKGIWVRDIRFKSNLPPTQLNKILKCLENKKIIKSVKSVAAGKKKVYMLFNLEPDTSLTGGAWYSDQDFESEFVDILNQQCYRFLLMKKDKSKEMLAGPYVMSNVAYSSVTEVLKFITDIGISKIKLQEDDIQLILNTLVYDGKVISKPSPEGSILYKAVDSLLPAPGVSRSPCGICPVQKDCEIGCAANPKTCSYLNEWLK